MFPLSKVPSNLNQHGHVVLMPRAPSSLVQVTISQLERWIVWLVLLPQRYYHWSLSILSGLFHSNQVVHQYTWKNRSNKINLPMVHRYLCFQPCISDLYFLPHTITSLGTNYPKNQVKPRIPKILVIFSFRINLILPTTFL